jgi:hypothetical protein
LVLLVKIDHQKTIGFNDKNKNILLSTRFNDKIAKKPLVLMIKTKNKKKLRFL